MAGDFANIAGLKAYLRRTKSVDELKDLADEAFSNVQCGVTLQNVSYEGGQASGTVTCNPAVLLACLEEILLEKGEGTREKTNLFSSFSSKCVET